MITAEERAYYLKPSVLIRFSVSLVGLLLVLSRMTNFLNQIELRPGALLADPVLQAIAPKDLTWLAFGLIYGGLVFAIFHLLRHPERLILGMQGYTIMLLLRAIAMSVLPLDPPPGIIVLKDPFVEFFGNSSAPLTRDLFFSGHTSTMFLLYLASVNPKIRYLFLVSTLGIAACVLIQHVHYTVDVVAAPFFAYGAMRMAGKFNVTLRRFFEARQSR